MSNNSYLKYSLKCISPIDGRYFKKTCDLSVYFSEFSFNKYRIFIEIEYLIALFQFNLFKENNKDVMCFLRSIYSNFNINECIKLKDIENITNHDVKSVEYYIKNKIKEKYGDTKISNFVHFGLTSQDINSSSNILMIKNSIKKVFIPNITKIIDNIKEKNINWEGKPLLAMTHGQPASPTFISKEIMVYHDRLQIQLNKLKNINYTTKFGGAVGNLNAHYFSIPNIDWLLFVDKFIDTIGLKRNNLTTQIDHYDNYGEIFDIIKRINVILIDLSQDIWLYISRNILKQKINKNEVGSSAMPHKINPINFENAEGNLLLGNSMLEFFSRKLPVSRLQRDLTDSTILRNVGTSFSYSLIGYLSIIEGLKKLEINEIQMKKELEENYMVIAEGIQTRMKVLGINNSYEKLKEITRINDNKDTRTKLQDFINECHYFDDSEKDNLNKLTPFNYTGKYDY